MASCIEEGSLPGCLNLVALSSLLVMVFALLQVEASSLGWWGGGGSSPTVYICAGYCEIHTKWPERKCIKLNREYRDDGAIKERV